MKRSKADVMSSAFIGLVVTALALLSAALFVILMLLAWVNIKDLWSMI